MHQDEYIMKTRTEKEISKEVYMPIMSRDCYFISTDKPMLDALITPMLSMVLPSGDTW
jgi:hypothetical protein